MVKPVTVVSKAIVKDCASVVISPVPKAESPGPNGIKVPSKPNIGPNLTKISVFEVTLTNLLSSSSINLKKKKVSQSVSQSVDTKKKEKS